MSFIIYILAKRPDIQDMVREEILEVLHDDEDEIHFEDLTALTYTQQVINETFRMYPFTKRWKLLIDFPTFLV